MSAQKGLTIERILRDREGVRREMLANPGLGAMTGSVLLTSLLCLAVYGALVGAPPQRPHAVDVVGTSGNRSN
jgi:hypothetical protein